jgi:beta-N-acetylhexosaminidase
MSFTPCVDLDLGLSEVIGDRALHADPRVVAALARRIAAGAKRAGMATTAKHFPTHAGARSDSHTEFAVDRRDYGELADDLVPYRDLIANGLQAVMIAHVSFPSVGPSVDPSVDEAPVITDDVSMVGAAVVGSIEERVRRALAAGCDLVLLCNSPDAVPGVLDAIEGFTNPPAQLRLTRLHGRGGLDWDALHASAEWRQAQAAVAPLCERPALSLQG